MDVSWHSLVLMGAWQRVDGWYRSGNLAPEPELSRWRLHPEAELRKLGSELRAGTWRPSRWPQVPYPKKGARLRHYVLPTVRDQVAFMAYLVLLGPLLDSGVPNFVFGNRWNRMIAWDRRRSKPQWIRRPYQLLTRTAYLPYARSHGLFRRVAHWTVARMTGAQIEEADYSGYVQHPDDYAASAFLPEWTRKEWWPARGSDPVRVYWATLESCDVPDRVKGLAVGGISLIGYAPDIYLPLIRGMLVDRIPGQWGYGIYFLAIAGFGIVGALAAWQLARITASRRSGHERRAGVLRPPWHRRPGPIPGNHPNNTRRHDTDTSA